MQFGVLAIWSGTDRIRMNALKRVQQLPNLVCLLGNHDAAVAGVIDITLSIMKLAWRCFGHKVYIKQVHLEYLEALSPSNSDRFNFFGTWQSKTTNLGIFTGYAHSL